jgi:hypothetical protein
VIQADNSSSLLALERKTTSNCKKEFPMQTMNAAACLHQECLDKLQQILDLAMHTAAAASAEGNHKIVLQAAREVTRIITLMTKMTGAPHQARGTGQKASPPPDGLDDLLSDLSALTQELGRGFPVANSVPDLDPGNSLPKTGHQHFQKREKGGKLPGKTSSLVDFFKKNKRLGEDEKISQTGS